jgi:hypothetical protein
MILIKLSIIVIYFSSLLCSFSFTLQSKYRISAYLGFETSLTAGSKPLNIPTFDVRCRVFLIVTMYLVNYVALQRIFIFEDENDAWKRVGQQKVAQSLIKIRERK